MGEVEAREDVFHILGEVDEVVGVGVLVDFSSGFWSDPYLESFSVEFFSDIFEGFFDFLVECLDGVAGEVGCVHADAVASAEGGDACGLEDSLDAGVEDGFVFGVEVDVVGGVAGEGDVVVTRGFFDGFGFVFFDVDASDEF